jgi:hypothetical protein
VRESGELLNAKGQSGELLNAKGQNDELLNAKGTTLTKSVTEVK